MVNSFRRLGFQTTTWLEERMLSIARSKTIIPSILTLLFMTVLPLFAQVSPEQGTFITSDGVKLRYLQAGRGESILFIPGWLMPSEVWTLQIKDLSQDHRVITLDPRSQGWSDFTPLGNDPLRRAMDIRELLDNLHLNSVVLVGWSLGAFDALAYLRQFGTDRLNALVLVDSPLAAPSGHAPTQRVPFLKLFQTDRMNADRNYVWSLFKKQAPKGFYKPLLKAADRIPTEIALATLDNTQPGETWAPSLSSLRQVSLLYAITPKYASQAAYLLKADPQARVETFPDSGHALFVDESVRFNALIRDFLRQASFYPPGLPESHRPSLHKLKTLSSVPVFPSPTSETTTLPNSIQPSPTPLLTPASGDIPLPIPTSTFTSTDTATPLPISSPPTAMASPALTVPPSYSGTPFESTSSQTVVPSVVTQPVTPVPTSPSQSTLTPTTLSSFSSWFSKTLSHLKGVAAPPTPLPTFTPIPPSVKPSPTESSPSEENPVQEGSFTTSDHVKLHYLESGQGLAIVLIPGWLLPAKIWKAQLEGLSSDYHVIALDPRSQGESDITAQGDDPVRQARDIQELLAHLGLTSVVLVGWSHGGFQVLAYMGEFGTDHLYAAVLVDSALAASSSATSTAPRARFLEQFQKDRPTATRSFIWSLFKTSPPVDFFHELVASAMKTPTDIALALMNNAFPGDPWQPSLVTMRQVPLLYAVTSKYTSQAAYLLQADPLARVEFFPQAGHALFYDDADHFNQTLRDFLAKSALYPAGLPETSKKQTTHSWLANPK